MQDALQEFFRTLLLRMLEEVFRLAFFDDEERADAEEQEQRETFATASIMLGESS